MGSTSAEELLNRAEKKASSTGGWFSSGHSKHEESVELFKEAANKFRIENRMLEAGQALVRAAEMEIKINERDFAATTFYDASKCFRMVRPDRAYFPRATAHDRSHHGCFLYTSPSPRD